MCFLNIFVHGGGGPAHLVRDFAADQVMKGEMRVESKWRDG